MHDATLCARGAGGHNYGFEAHNARRLDTYYIIHQLNCVRLLLAHPMLSARCPSEHFMGDTYNAMTHNALGTPSN
jgi:hypothetical protein